MSNISLIDLSNENKQLKQQGSYSALNVLVLSNITVEQSEIPFKNSFLKAGFDAHLTYGNYNNIIGDSKNAPDHDVTIILWELANIIEDFFYKYFALNEAQKQELIEKIKTEIDLVYANIANAPLCFVTQFTAQHFFNDTIASHAFESIVTSLNDYLKEHKPLSVSLVNPESIYMSVSRNSSIDFRMYNLFKSLYTTEFYFQFARLLCPTICRNRGKVKKVLILDCDNTLWHGIVGEDGFDGIDMSLNSKKGVNFGRVQYLIKGLHQRGILLCICSKNNHDDVQKVFDTHPDMVLRATDFVVQKVNWISKAENIKEIAQELNLGLDSFVFLDDSDFEVNLIREQLPQVKVYQVPKKGHLYPDLFNAILNDFYNPQLLAEDIVKTELYNQEFKRNSLKKQYNNHSEYLESLGLQLFYDCDNAETIARVSQMTQKTNQFNFTTKRYSVAEIEKFVNSDKHKVLSFSVQDKYGDYGITALVILDYQDKLVEVDTFLMSCRIIGRDLELAIIDTVFEQIDSKIHEKIVLKLLHTDKNIVVKEFGEKFGFDLNESTATHKIYTKEIKKYKPFKLGYIAVKAVELT
jgi:FkbH-like protein